MEAEGGLVDKFVGDGVMAVFGRAGAGGGGTRPRRRRRRRAPRAGWTPLPPVADWAAERVDRRAGTDRPSASASIVGTVLAGSFGGEDRLEFTVIGDTVNVAERIEESTRDA